MTDSTEMYYAEMEAARNTASEAYFSARPQIIITGREQMLFNAGFERAFKPLWDRLQATASPSQSAGDTK